MRYVTLLTVLFAGLVSSATASSPTGWSSVILPTGQYRTQIKSMPIVERPGRLLHFYGNTIRMVDQSRKGVPTRPIRQILIGTTSLRQESPRTVRRR